MANSEVSICKLALTRIGQDPNIITALTDNRKEARLCTLHYEPTRDAVLRAHVWNFAIKRATLALDVTEPDFEFASRFALPADCLKVIRTESDVLGFGAEYRVEGRWIFTDDDELAIEYVAQITDVNQFDALFVDVLAQRLAAEMCIALNGNANMTENLWKIYNDKLGEARSTDAQEGSPRDIFTNTWLAARV